MLKLARAAVGRSKVMGPAPLRQFCANGSLWSTFLGASVVAVAVLAVLSLFSVLGALAGATGVRHERCRFAVVSLLFSALSRSLARVFQVYSRLCSDSPRSLASSSLLAQSRTPARLSFHPYRSSSPCAD